MTSRPEIFVRTALRHPRLRYVLRVIGDDLGYRFRFFNDRSVFPRPEPPFVIDYGGNAPRSLPAHPLLSGKDVALASTALQDGTPVFCRTPRGPDLLACIFFALSRYEEYQPFTPDAHGRFPASASHAVRHDYLRRPVVREWTAAIGRRLRRWFPDLPPPRRRPFAFRPTYDIDLLWAYRFRGWRAPAAAARQLLSGEFRALHNRLTCSPETDPYFTLPDLLSLHDRHRLEATYFWLLADGQDRRDPNPFPVPHRQISWMRKLAERGAIMGIHPSYHSPERPELIARERQRLENLLHRDIRRSRQHFLRVRLPGTYRHLLEAGITDDHSMGYADRVGWRAGTNLPFPWYDLERERMTELTVHPFAAMDVTLRQYAGLAGADAGASIRGLAEGVRAFGGEFALLWHNSSFSPDHGWAGWWEMYRELVAELAATSGETGR